MHNKCMGLYGNLTVCDNPNYSRNTKYVKNKSLYAWNQQVLKAGWGLRQAENKSPFGKTFPEKMVRNFVHFCEFERLRANKLSVCWQKAFSLICNHHTLWLLTCFKEMCSWSHKVSMTFFSFFFPANTNKKICCFQATASVICKTLFFLVIRLVFPIHIHIYIFYMSKSHSRNKQRPWPLVTCLRENKY